MLPRIASGAVLARIAVHDFAGHPPQMQLSRALAARGHEVCHLFNADVTTGRGAVARRSDDPSSLHVVGVRLDGAFARYHPGRRLRDEAIYARRLQRRLQQFRPDVLLSANTPVTSQARVARWCRRIGCRFVFWLQDVLSVGTASQLRRRLGPAGSMLGAALEAIERRVLRRADGVVAITDAFLPLLDAWRVPASSTFVVENWAPLDELAPHRMSNSWADEHQLTDRPVLLYSGTLGLKHDPSLLSTLAQALAGRADVVVVSEGLGADWLRRHAREHGLVNLRVLPFQPYERLPQVLATATVLLALLEAEAGAFSVPSKVLTYHCAERPLLASIPKENLAARIIEREGSGIVVAPGDGDAFVTSALRLLGDGELRRELGARARAYAERAFDIERITDRFEEALRLQ